MDDKERFRLSCDILVDDGDYIWFPLFAKNGLVKVKKGTNIAEYVLRFPGYDNNQMRLFSAVAMTHDKIIFAPGMADKIAVYDIKEKKISMLEFEKRSIGRKTWTEDGYWFRSVIVRGNVAFFMPLNYKGILQLDLMTGKMDIIDDWVDEIEGIVEKGNDELYLAHGCINGDVCMFPFRCADAVLSFDLKFKKTKILCLGSGQSGYAGMAYDGKNYWLTPMRFDSVARWNGIDEGVTQVQISYNNEFDRAPFHRPIIANGFVYLLPVFCENVYKIDIESNEVLPVRDLDFIFKTKEYENPIGWDYVQALYQYDKKLMFITGKDAQWHIYDTLSGKCEDFCIYPDERGYFEYILYNFENEDSVGIWGEDNYTTLSDFLVYLKYDHKNFAEAINEEKSSKSVGEKILCSIM